MKSTQHAVRLTISFGLAAGILFGPLHYLLTIFIGHYQAMGLVLGLCLGGYGLLLTAWGRKNPAITLLPALLPVLAVTVGLPLDTFLLLALAILAWMRSGLCFPRSLPAAIGIELLLCGGGVLLVRQFVPFPTYSAATTAVAIWLFFLVQSLYFVLFAPPDPADAPPPDPFARACRQAEKILAGEPE